MSTHSELAGQHLPAASAQENVPGRETQVPGRRIHEIDALRSIALLLLIAYHALCAFQPFAWMVGLVGFSEHLPGLWLLGELLNTWRIPVLFLLAGVTGGHLLGNRQPAELLRSRLLRLVPPLLMGMFVVVPLSGILFQSFNHTPIRYTPGLGHLWFVWNLAVYFVMAFPFLVLVKRFPQFVVLRVLRSCSPYIWLVLLPGLLGATTIVLEPHITSEYFSAHFLRFWYGLACFVSGVLMASFGESFWAGIRGICRPALFMAIALYAVRVLEVDLGGATVRLWANSFESAYGMLAFLGYGSRLFGRPSSVFSRVNRSVFAVYIVHFPVQQALALFLVPLGLPAWPAFAILFIATLTISASVYGVVLRPLPWLHPFFGIPRVKAVGGHREPSAGAVLAPGRWASVIGRGVVLYFVSPLLVLVTFSLLAAAALESWQAGAGATVRQQPGERSLGIGPGPVTDTPSDPMGEERP